MKYAILAVLLFSSLVLFGCTQGTGNTDLNSLVGVQNKAIENTNTNTDGAGLANPASVYCEQQGGELQIQETAAGQVGYCVFDDGRICEEWAFYRNEGDECISPEEMDTEFCGTSTNGACEDDSECIEGGCSSQVCMSEAEGDAGGVTTCEYRECYNAGAYGLSCGCVDGECQWA